MKMELKQIVVQTFSCVFGVEDETFGAGVLHHVTPGPIGGVVRGADGSCHVLGATSMHAGDATGRPTGVAIRQTYLMIAASDLFAGGRGFAVSFVGQRDRRSRSARLLAQMAGGGIGQAVGAADTTSRRIRLGTLARALDTVRCHVLIEQAVLARRTRNFITGTLACAMVGDR